MDNLRTDLVGEVVKVDGCEGLYKIWAVHRSVKEHSVHVENLGCTIENIKTGKLSWVWSNQLTMAHDVYAGQAHDGEVQVRKELPPCIDKTEQDDKYKTALENILKAADRLEQTLAYIDMQKIAKEALE